ncbi:Thioesterase/thiol ester dehydrase-isomerase [Xylariaceae sp. FL0594]|nr:Thioesterase/thiol ester dehydrase-isomerase [Xylariaceae sp. FL0594]
MPSLPGKAPIEDHIAVTPAVELGPDVFTNAVALPREDGQRSALGAFLASQAVTAACATVSTAFRPYSSQSTFIAPANGDEKIIYRVERVSDGRNFATRIVRASQGTASVYIAVISFQSIASTSTTQLKYSLPMVELDGTPDDVDPSAMASMQRSMVDPSAPVLLQNPQALLLDWRPYSLEAADEPTGFRVRGFVRAAHLSSKDPVTHLAALAYASDDLFFGIALAANPVAVGRGWRNVAFAASLTHNISFHDTDAKIDEWLVLERETSWGAEGRVMVHQKFWARETGHLVLSASQEAVIRLRGPKM